MRVVFFLLFLTVGISACNNESSTAKSSAKDNSTNEDNTERFDSLDYFDQQIRKSPKDIDLYFAKAKHLAARRNYNDAISALDKGVTIDSANAELYAFRSDLHYKMKQIEKSMSDVETALDLDETNIRANRRAAWIYYILQDYENTFKYVNKVLAEDENDAESYLIKGMAYKEQEKFNLSISSFRTAVEQDNDYYDAWIQLGLLHGLAEHEHTPFYYDNAIRVDSTKYEAHYNKAYYLQESLGEYREAIKSYDAILRHNPNFYNAYFNKGYIYLEYLDVYDSAQMMFTRVTEINPSSYKSYLHRGIAFERQGDLQRAIEDINKALKMKPDYDAAALAKSRVAGKL